MEASYQSAQYDEKRILDRLAYYGSNGIEQEITALQLLTDNQGQAFREQVLAFMEQRNGIQIMQELTGLSAKWEEQEITGNQLAGQIEQEWMENGSVVEAEAAELLQAKSLGILSLVKPKTFTISNKQISREQQISNRTLHTGRGTFSGRTGMNGVEEKLLYQKYLEEQFSSAIEKKAENRTMDYELEYILYGKSSDKENLEAVVNRLLLVRFAMNYAYLRSNTQKQEEAAALAATISMILLQPELVEVAKEVLLILWGFGESVMDIRTLLAGNRVAMVKDDTNWQLQLSSVFQLGTAMDMQEGRDDENGMKYTQYMQILLFLGQSSEITMRTLDRVEENLIYEKGMKYFKADTCVTRIKLQNTADIWNGRVYQFPCEFGYNAQ